MLRGIRPSRPSPGIIIAILALVAALVGTAMAEPTANTAVSKKKVKKIAKKQANKVFNARADELQGPPGEQGPRGLRGLPGQDATKLFAYIRDSGGTDTATVQYAGGGPGSVEVVDPSGNSLYLVSFNRSIQNCVVQAVAGRGDPAGSTPDVANAFPAIDLTQGAANTASVQFGSLSGTVVDTSFMITAFC